MKSIELASLEALEINVSNDTMGLIIFGWTNPLNILSDLHTVHFLFH